jgi:hypothetical protein
LESVFGVFTGDLDVLGVLLGVFLIFFGVEITFFELTGVLLLGVFVILWSLNLKLKKKNTIIKMSCKNYFYSYSKIQLTCKIRL